MRKLLILFSLIFHQVILAADGSHSHFSTSIDEIVFKKSSVGTSISTESIKSRIQTITSDNKLEDRDLHGITLKAERTALIDAFNFLFTRRGHYAKNDFIQTQINFNSYPGLRDCQKVFCVVEKVWGIERGLRVLWIMLRYGFNASEYAYDDSETLKTAELDDVIKTLEFLPLDFKDGISIFGKNIPVLAFKNITGLRQEPHHTVLADSSIFIFDSLRNQSSPERIRALYHELGHLISHQGELKKNWLNISGWEFGATNCSVSSYGDTTSGEDFAETFVQYRFASARLKKSCPEKYKFMKEYVFDVEALDREEGRLPDILLMYRAEKVQEKTPSIVSELDFHTQKFNKTIKAVVNAILNQSRFIDRIELELKDAGMNFSFQERDHTVEIPIRLKLLTSSGFSQEISCSLRFEMFGIKATLGECSPEDSIIEIKKFLKFKWKKVYLNLIKLDY